RLDGGRHRIAVVHQSLPSKGHHQNTVRGGDAYRHDGAHQCGHAECRVGDKQEQDEAGQRGGQRREDDEGIEPRLKIDDDQEIHQDDGEDEATQQADVGRMHRLQLSPNSDETATRQRGSMGIDDTGEVTADGAEVAVLHGAVNIHDAADVVVRYHLHLTGARDRGDVREDFRTRHDRCTGHGLCTDGDVLEILQRLNVVLGGHGGDVIFDPVVPIQEEGRRGLEAAAQRHQQATGDVSRGAATLGCLGAVHGDIELRVLEGLLNVVVG